MSAIADVRAISFMCETMSVRGGRHNGRLKADEHGYYNDVPLAVLGIVSENNTFYKPESIVQQVNNEASPFRRVLTRGGLYGEWGHPKLSGFSKNAEALERVLTVDEDRQSHHFKRINTGEVLSDGSRLVLGSLRPQGPKAQYLKDNFENPLSNTAFSLRSVADNKVVNGIQHRDVRRLVTFDYVGVGGYIEAAKWHSPSAAVESYMYDVNDVSVFSQSNIALENLVDTELNEILGANTIQIRQQKFTVLSTKTLMGSDRRKTSVFHEFMKLLDQE